MTFDNNFCCACPRHCKVNRAVQKGFCNQALDLQIAKTIAHFAWEEPCVCGTNGTFAVFFSGCNLRCEFCQNIKISRGGVGQFFSVEEFAKMIEDAQKTHQSIDLITPTHFSEKLCQAFEKICKTVPVIWNSNGYETPEMIEKVSKFVDIFLVDFKYASNQLGATFSAAKDYFSCATRAIEKMCSLKKDVFEDFPLPTDDNSTGNNSTDENSAGGSQKEFNSIDRGQKEFNSTGGGKNEYSPTECKQNGENSSDFSPSNCNSTGCKQMKQGVIIRHLVLPGHVQNSIGVLDEIKSRFPNRMVSIMSQFTPNGFGRLRRKLLPIEYKAVLAHMEKLGLNYGYVQDFASAENDFVPDF